MRSEKDIPEVAIETLARAFCREAAGYGFGHVDYVRFVNAVLERSLHPACESGAPPAPRELARGEPAVRLPLLGRRVAVRALEPAEDLPRLSAWLADEYGRDFLLSRVTARKTELDALVRDPGTIFGIVTLLEGTPVGAVAFLEHDAGQRKAEMRKLIGAPEHRGKGLAKEASALWIRYGLEALGLQKIYVSTFHANMRNVRLNRELGFRVEGILRHEVQVDGAWHDVLRMGLWADGDPAEGRDDGETDDA